MTGLLVWLLRVTGLLHALELDHSPSRTCLGTCTCKTCRASVRR
jgi:ferredoxin